MRILVLVWSIAAPASGEGGRTLFHSYDHPHTRPVSSAFPRHAPVGFISSDREFWLLLADACLAESPRALADDGTRGIAPATWMCRAVLEGGWLRVSPVDAERSSLLDDILENG